MIPSFLYTACFLTGSSYICDPPVLDTDIDKMFLVNDLDKTSTILMDLGWKSCGANEYAIGEWLAFRKGNLNAIITTSPTHFLLFQHATNLAKEKNLLKKEDRVALFKEICGKMTQKKKDYSNEW